MKRRQTPSKQVVLSTLIAARRALSQEDIEKQVTGSMDRVTIYRILNAFCEDGITHRIIGEDGRSYFAVCMNCTEYGHSDDHFHFRCRQCGRIECLEETVRVTAPAGYVVEQINCLLTGSCALCSA